MGGDDVVGVRKANDTHGPSSRIRWMDVAKRNGRHRQRCVNENSVVIYQLSLRIPVSRVTANDGRHRPALSSFEIDLSPS